MKAKSKVMIALACGMMLVVACGLAGVSAINDQISSAESDLKIDQTAIAVENLTPLARLGSPEAQLLLAYAYTEGGEGVQKDALQVRRWSDRVRHNVWASASDRRQADWFLTHAMPITVETRSS